MAGREGAPVAPCADPGEPAPRREAQALGDRGRATPPPSLPLSSRSTPASPSARLLGTSGVIRFGATPGDLSPRLGGRGASPNLAGRQRRGKPAAQLGGVLESRTPAPFLVGTTRPRAHRGPVLTRRCLRGLQNSPPGWTCPHATQKLAGGEEVMQNKVRELLPRQRNELAPDCVACGSGSEELASKPSPTAHICLP